MLRSSQDFADAVEKHIFSNNWGAKKEGYRPQSEFPGFLNLYLVDENDGKLIVGEGYPVKIDMEKDKELLESLIPLCRVTMQSIALRLGGAGIVKMFCDFVDKVEVLNEITNYAGAKSQGAKRRAENMTITRVTARSEDKYKYNKERVRTSLSEFNSSLRS